MKGVLRVNLDRCWDAGQVNTWVQYAVLGSGHGCEEGREIKVILRATHDRGGDAGRLNAQMRETGLRGEHKYEDGK